MIATNSDQSVLFSTEVQNYPVNPVRERGKEEKEMEGSLNDFWRLRTLKDAMETRIYDT